MGEDINSKTIPKMQADTQCKNQLDFDKPVQDIADYICEYVVENNEIFDTARLCLMDSLGCALLALRFPECFKLLGPIVPGTSVTHGARVPGTQFEMDPVKTAFDLGVMIHWMGHNDVWPARGKGNPSDNLGAILAVSDFVSRQRLSNGHEPLIMKDLLCAMIKAYEIQGVIALENDFKQLGLDQIVLIKIASVAVVTHLLGGEREQIMDAVSQVLVDGLNLRIYRQQSSSGLRRYWAAGDATSRAVKIALMTLAGEKGYPSVLSADRWGFYDALFNGQAFNIQRNYGEHVMNNIVFNLDCSVEIYAQTAVACALKLHPEAVKRLDAIDKIIVSSQALAIELMDRSGKLKSPGERAKSLQFMVAVALLFGALDAHHYEEDWSSDSAVELLKAKIIVKEDCKFTQEFFNSSERSISNALQIFYNDGTSSKKEELKYPLGHKMRRNEGEPLLVSKFERNIRTRFPDKHADDIINLCQDKETFENLAVNEFVDLLVI